MTEAEMAELYEVDARTLLEWRARGLPYKRLATGAIAYALPHAPIWRTFWLKWSLGLRKEVLDIPFECALAYNRYERALVEYLGVDGQHGGQLPPEIRAIPPAEARWRPNDWSDRQARAGRHSYRASQ